MNRRSLVLSASALGAAAFAGGSWLVRDRQAREAAAEADARTAAIPDPNALLLRPTAPVLGPEDAPVTLVEFFDPSCEACRAFHPVLKQLRAEFPDSLRIVMRYAAFHQGSDEAVAILEAARRQNMFEPVLNAVRLQCHFSWMQCCCSGCSAPCIVRECGCSAQAVDAVSHKVDAVCCDGGCRAHEGGCSDAAVVAVPPKLP